MKKGNVHEVFCPPCGENVGLPTKRGFLNKEPSFTTPLPAYGVLPPQGGQITASGFTLIELLVVVLIIGILAAVAVPQYQKAVEKARATQLYTLLSAMAKAQQTYRLATGNYAGNFSKLDINFPYESGDETERTFIGGDYTWNKCVGDTCLFGWKEYKDGRYALQVYFDTGNFVCIATRNTKAIDICKSLGFTVVMLHSDSPWQMNTTYYKQP